ncbi:class IV adenylate cyclase [Kitasatospora sp. NPDC085464]|uniref:class IV adenylate cyclase n=1 Tax=Kitasatospora sp. NPDC085464 TaxID=3364063 RepID=UPI0037C74390
MIEAELKALVRQPGVLLRHLEGLHGPGRAEVYRDTYYDLPDGSLLAADRELRIREIESSDGGRRALLTHKGARVDDESGSKPEHETAVADAGAAHAILRGLGYLPRLAFEKHCRNYTLERDGRRFLATLVRVPQLAGVFLEVETAAARVDELAPALAAVRAVLGELGVGEADVTGELYTDAVLRAGGAGGAGGADGEGGAGDRR